MSADMDLPLFVAARRSDPMTSQLNRDAFVKKATQRDALLMTYALVWQHYEQTFGEWSSTDGTLTDEEAGMQTPWGSASMYDLRICYWKRCSELRKLGYIEPTGITRESRAGQQQQACQITDEGRAHLASLVTHG